MKKTILFISLIVAIGANAQNALLIPDTISGTTVNLDLQNGTHQFYNGVNTTTMGANGGVLGPTLLLNQGDSVSFSVTNNIADTTTIHWHGLHVSSENDGGPHTYIVPGATWTPSFTIRDKAATYWYHPHLHHKTNKHVSMGIAGFIIVRDSEEAALDLPRKYGVDDFPLVIQTKDFDASSQIIVPSNNDDVIMVNATLDAYLDVPAQVIRYRLLNGSSQRSFYIGLTNDMAFSQIASDGGLLSAPVTLTRLLLAPGERAEILVDFSGMSGQSIDLISYASEFLNGIYGATNPGMNASMTLNGYNPNPLNGADFTMLKFNVGTQNGNPVTGIPSNLVTVTRLDSAASDFTRKLEFTSAIGGRDQLNGDFLINNVSFDIDVINYTIPFNNTEIWEIDNSTAISHPFHIHDVQFYILDRDGVMPDANEQGRKDVILVKPQEVVRVIAKFETFSNSTVPYMYHCHMLVHEDGGMMGQFVVHNPLSVRDIELDSKLNVYPNPATDEVVIVGDFNEVANVKVYNSKGVLMKEFTAGGETKLITKNWSQGMYYVIYAIGNDVITKTFVVVK